MGVTLKRTLACLFLMQVLFGCAAAVEKFADTSSLATTVTTTTYTCSTFSGYDSLDACQTASQANCTSTWESFPSGGVGLCYFPPVGFEACLVVPQTWDWIYTSYSDWCNTGTTSGGLTVYKKTRSVIGCSSTLCNCGNAQVTTATCTGTGTCPVFATIPSACP